MFDTISSHTATGTDDTAEALNQLVDRMAKAGWLGGLNQVWTTHFSLEFTGKGCQRMRQIAKVGTRIKSRSWLTWLAGQASYIWTFCQVGADFKTRITLQDSCLLMAMAIYCPPTNGWVAGVRWVIPEQGALCWRN